MLYSDHTSVTILIVIAYQCSYSDHTSVTILIVIAYQCSIVIIPVSPLCVTMLYSDHTMSLY